MSTHIHRTANYGWSDITRPNFKISSKRFTELPCRIPRARQFLNARQAFLRCFCTSNERSSLVMIDEIWMKRGEFELAHIIQCLVGWTVRGYRRAARRPGTSILSLSLVRSTIPDFARSRHRPPCPGRLTPSARGAVESWAGDTVHRAHQERPSTRPKLPLLSPLVIQKPSRFGRPPHSLVTT